MFRHVVVPNPDVRGRTHILKLHLKGVPIASDLDVEIVARGTPGFSGAGKSCCSLLVLMCEKVLFRISWPEVFWISI